VVALALGGAIVGVLAASAAALWLVLAAGRPAAVPAVQAGTAPAPAGKTASSPPPKLAHPKAGGPGKPQPVAGNQDTPVRPRRTDAVGPAPPEQPPAPKDKGPVTSDPPGGGEPPPAKAEPAPDAQLGKLLERLKSPLKAEQLAAIKEIGNRGTAGKAAVPPLADQLCREGKEFADQANQAARALGQIGWPAVPALLKALEHPSAAVRQRTLWALGVIGPDAPEAVQPVSAFLADKDAKVRVLAAQVLGEMGPVARPAVPALALALRDPDAQVRAQAAVALHEIGPETAEHLLKVARVGELPARLSAVQSLVIFHEESAAVEALVEALRDGQVQVRAAAAAGLSRLGPMAKAALPGLLNCLQEDNLELQTQALTALMAIGSAKDTKLLEVLAVVNAATTWANPTAKPSPAQRKQLVQRLTLALDDPDSMRRLGAVLALLNLGSEAKEGLGRLRKTLQEDRSRVVLAAALLAVLQLDQKYKVEGKTFEMLLDEVTGDLKKAKKRDVEELVQLYLLTATLSCPANSRSPFGASLKAAIDRQLELAVEMLDEVEYSPWSLPSLVRGLNNTAEFQLGFTEPFGRLSLKYQALIREAKDIEPLNYALAHLGQRTPGFSPFFIAMERNRLAVFANPTFLDWLIGEQQKVNAQVAAGVSVMIRNWAKANGGVCHLGFRSMGFTPTGLLDDKDLRDKTPLGKVQLELQLLLHMRAQVSLSKNQNAASKLAKESDSALVATLQSPDTSIQWAAAVLVGRKRIAAADELVSLLAEPSMQVREAAHQALVRLARGTDFGPYPGDAPAKVQMALQRWRSWLTSQSPLPSRINRRLAAAATDGRTGLDNMR
jgi:HEAT repeat protein